MKIWKQWLVYLLSFSVASTSSSLAFAAVTAEASQTANLKEFYKSTGYKSGAEVRPWLAKNSDKIHFKMKAMMDRLIMTHPELKLPSVDFSDFQQDGKTITRLVVKGNGEQVLIDIYKNNDEYLAKIGGQTFSYDDFYYDGIFNKGDVNPMLTLEQLQKAQEASPPAALNYQVNFREFINELERFHNQANAEPEKEVSFVDFILSVAYAGEADRLCIVAGHMSRLSQTPGHTGYCGGDEKQAKIYCNKTLASGFNCNGLAYGFNKQGSEICVPFQPGVAPATYVSQECESRGFPLDSEESKKNFVQSILDQKAKLGISDEADFVKKLREYIDSASASCGVSPAAIEERMDNKMRFVENDFLKAFPNRKTQKRFDYNQGHRTACEKLLNRLVLVKQAADCTEKRFLAGKDPQPEDFKQMAKDCPNLLPNAYSDANSAPQQAPSPAPEPAPVVTKPPPTELPRVVTEGKVSKGNICTQSTGAKVACFAGAALLACGLLGCFKGSPRKKSIGKPGEAVKISLPPALGGRNRPAIGTPQVVPGAR